MRYLSLTVLTGCFVLLLALSASKCHRGGYFSYWEESEVIEKGNKAFPEMYEPQKKVKEGEVPPPPILKACNEIHLSTKTSPEHIFRTNLNNRWDYISPWKDRADQFQHIHPLINFTEHAEVLDSFPAKGKDLSEYGLAENYTRVSFRSPKGEPILTYRIGKKAAWHKKEIIKANKTNPRDTIIYLPTVYIQKENTEDSGTIYLVADPHLNLPLGVNTLFKNEFEGFRHHHPFALNIHYLEEVYIKRDKSEILIDRSTPSSPWRIAKPLDLATDKAALKKFLEGISRLKAVKLHKTDSVTLPQETEGIIELYVKSFSVEQRIKLTIYPPKEEDDTCFATVSDRDIIFELPLTTAKNIESSVADIPENINSLRARNMLSVNTSQIQGFTITNRSGSRILISRPRAKTPLELQLANNKRSSIEPSTLQDFFQSVSIDPVKNFVTDAATDFNLYGFNDPILTIRVYTFSGSRKPITLRFSRVRKQLTEEEQEKTPDHLDGVVEYIYANIVGSPVVWEVDPKSFIKIASNEWNWKPSTIWQLAVNEVKSFSLQPRKSPPILVDYNYFDDEFKASFDGKDVTNQLNPNKAKYFLNNTHQLKASKRLGANNPIAKKALENPLLTCTVSVQMYDNFNAPTEIKTFTISFAPVGSNAARSSFYYAKASNDEDYFMVDAKTYFGFATNLFAED